VINIGFLNTNSAITQQLMQTAKTVEKEWRGNVYGRLGMMNLMHNGHMSSSSPRCRRRRMRTRKKKEEQS
jgi:hypothetical protein